MKISAHSVTLQLRVPFKISYGASTTRENVLVSIDEGVGEGAVVPYYGETPQRIISYVQSREVQKAVDHFSIEDLRLPPGESSAARAAVDLALHDLWGKQQGHPLYRLWGLNPATCPRMSYTIPMSDDDDTYRQMLREKQGYPLIKLKLGSGSLEKDLWMVKTAAAEMDGTLCVDANNAWTADQALTIIPQLTDLGVLFVEQPVGRYDMDGWRKISTELPEDRPPLIADESVQGVDSISPLAGLADGINIKLAKCGGLFPARQMIHQARELGMKIMLGCMVETSVAITAMSHLAPLADYLDLDGNQLLIHDPFMGMTVDEHGTLTLPDAPGLGVTPRAE